MLPFVYFLAAILGTGNATIGIYNDEKFSSLIWALRDAGAPVAGLAGSLEPAALTAVRGIAVVAAAGGPTRLRPIRRALAAREGAIVGLASDEDPRRFLVERVLCVDTTAAGGNATLLAAAGT